MEYRKDVFDDDLDMLSLSEAAGAGDFSRFRALLQDRTPELSEIFAAMVIPKLRKKYWRLLLENSEVLTGVDESGRNALFPALESGNPVLIRKLLQLGLNPLKRDESGETPLSKAVCDGRLSFAKCLLGAAKNPAAFHDRNGCNLLHMAACGNLPSIAETLIVKHRMDVESRNRDGETPLHIAVKNQSIRMIRFLATAAHADLNARNNEGDTPIFHAASDSCLKIAGILCTYGADLFIRNSAGLTVAEYAMNCWEFKAAKFLAERAGCSRRQILEMTARKKEEKAAYFRGLAQEIAKIRSDSPDVMI